MKSILLPIDQSEQMPSALETARLLASPFEGTVEGVALRPAFAEIVAPDPIVAVTIPPADWNETEFCRGVRQAFDGFATAHPAGQGSNARFRWRGGSAIEDSTLGSLARVYDVTVLSRPGARGSRMSALEAALFDSGHPVLMAPPLPPRSFGESVFIHWNASTETARATAFGLSLLHQAKRVVVLSVEGGMAPGPSGGQLATYLRRNGIEAEAMDVKPGRRSTGEAILETAASLNCDLLIKGAYTQSRLRHMIFGGATSHILAEARLPVLMAH